MFLARVVGDVVSTHRHTNLGGRKLLLVRRLDLDDNKSLFLQILPEGTECYVVGTPSWESAPPASSGLYRDNPVLPTFRSTPEHPAWFADRSEALLRADHTWAFASWVVWAGMCAAIAATQIAGWT